jgi:hypothetical protein
MIVTPTSHCEGICFESRYINTLNWVNPDSLHTMQAPRGRGGITPKSKEVLVHTMETLGGEEVLLLLIHHLGASWGWVVSVTPRPRFTPGERTPGTHWIAGWVGVRAGLDTDARGKKYFRLCRGSNLDRPLVQPVARHFADWATTVPGITPNHYIIDLGTRWGSLASVTPRPCFTSGERIPGIHCIGVWMRLRAGLDTDDRGKILCLCRG